jgi:hypothetical protein
MKIKVDRINNLSKLSDENIAIFKEVYNELNQNPRFPQLRAFIGSAGFFV